MRRDFRPPARRLRSDDGAESNMLPGTRGMVPRAALDGRKTMKRRTTFAAICAPLLLVAFAAPAGAQSAKTVAGTYAAFSIPAYGDKPRGMMVLGADGHYSIIIARAALPKFAANSRVKG